MKIYNKIVYDFDNNIIEEDSYEYEGPITLAGSTLVAAAPYIVGATAVMGITQAGAAGKFNQSVEERNALVQEQKNEILDSKLDLELSRFDKDLKLLIATQTVNTAKSGAVIGSGTAQNIKLSTLYTAEADKKIATYNNEIAKSRNLEEANFSRIRGQMARQRAKMEQISIASSVGSSLLTMTG